MPFLLNDIQVYVSMRILRNEINISFFHISNYLQVVEGILYWW